MNDYERIKDFVFDRLKKKQFESSVLEETDIDNEIENTKKLLRVSDAVKLLFNGKIGELSSNDWIKMKREL